MSRRKNEAHDFELNLTPIIDCFVTLICFLLLSATYVNLVGLEAKVPVAVPASSPQAKVEPKFKLDLIAKAGSVELAATGAGSASGRRVIPNVAGKVDYASLHAALVRIKAERPKEFSINFESDTEMKYEELVRLMDTTRNLDPKDPPFTVTDDRNGKTVKVDALFPDFVIVNLFNTGGRS